MLVTAALDRGRVDACPTPVALHAARDGSVARVRLPGGRVDAAGLSALALLSAELGDGSLDITSRGNVQVRGLLASSGPAFAAGLAAAGLLPSEAHDHVRGTTASPLGDLSALVAELDAGLLADPASAALSGRFHLALDDGSGHAGAETADLALVDGTLVVAGLLTTLRGGADLLLEAVRTFLALRGDAVGVWRVRDLTWGPDSIADALGTVLVSPLAPSPGRLPLGPTGMFLVVAAPLQRLTGAQALAVADQLTGSLRLATAGRLVLPNAAARVGALRDAGLLVDAADRRGLVTACSGLAGCARALTDVRTRALVDLPAQRPLHWAGCDRVCGRPADAAAVVATEAGLELRP